MNKKITVAAIVAKILEELNGRSGFDDWWGNIDSETQEEITCALEKVTMKELTKAETPYP